jgi:hypothetical protein
VGGIVSGRVVELGEGWGGGFGTLIGEFESWGVENCRRDAGGPRVRESLCGGFFLLGFAVMRLCILLAAMLALTAVGAEREFNFGQYAIDQTPSNFLSTVSGKGKPGEWKVVLDQARSAMPARDANAPAMTQHAVVAQLARYAVDDHFPLLVFKDDTFNDFTFTTRFKISGGAMAQMGGIVFRYQDEKNYYVLMASVLDKHFWFFKIVNGVRSDKLIGPAIEIAKDEWREMSVKCEGNHIHCLLDGKEIIPMITDSSFSVGKIGFWTKSDSVSYFADAKLVYTPRETLAQSLVSDTVKKFPKLVGLKIFAVRPGASDPVVVAGKDEKDINQAGGDAVRDVIHNGKTYFGKDKKAGTVSTTVPLRDRNGEAIAAVVFVMNSFPGETEDTAAIKAQGMIKTMQPRVTSLEDLLQ